MTIVHKVTGYDRKTDKLELAFDLPDGQFGEVRQLVNLPPLYDTSTHGSFPLSADAAAKVSILLKLRLNLDEYNWFIEPFAPGSF